MYHFIFNSANFRRGLVSCSYLDSLLHYVSFHLQCSLSEFKYNIIINSTIFWSYFKSLYRKSVLVWFNTFPSVRFRVPRWRMRRMSYSLLIWSLPSPKSQSHFYNISRSYDVLDIDSMFSHDLTTNGYVSTFTILLLLL